MASASRSHVELKVHLETPKTSKIVLKTTASSNCYESYRKSKMSLGPGGKSRTKSYTHPWEVSCQ